MTSSLHTKAYSNLVAILVTARQERRLTQQQVAERLGKPQSFVAKIEGRERRLDVVEFIAFARALETDPAALFAEVIRAGAEKS